MVRFSQTANYIGIIVVPNNESKAVYTINMQMQLDISCRFGILFYDSIQDKMIWIQMSSPPLHLPLQPLHLLLRLVIQTQQIRL